MYREGGAGDGEEEARRASSLLETRFGLLMTQRQGLISSLTASQGTIDFMVFDPEAKRSLICPMELSVERTLVDPFPHLVNLLNVLRVGDEVLFDAILRGDKWVAVRVRTGITYDLRVSSVLFDERCSCRCVSRMAKILLLKREDFGVWSSGHKKLLLEAYREIVETEAGRDMAQERVNERGFLRFEDLVDVVYTLYFDVRAVDSR